MIHDSPVCSASRLFEGDEALSSIFVASNEIVVRRDAGWDDELIATVSRLIGDFFLFYRGE